MKQMSKCVTDLDSFSLRRCAALIKIWIKNEPLIEEFGIDSYKTIVIDEGLRGGIEFTDDSLEFYNLPIVVEELADLIAMTTAVGL